MLNMPELLGKLVQLRDSLNLLQDSLASGGAPADDAQRERLGQELEATMTELKKVQQAIAALAAGELGGEQS